MSGLYDSLKKNGYSPEEAYFHKENQKLIEQIRQNKGELPQDQGTVINAQERFQKNSQQTEVKKKKAA